MKTLWHIASKQDADIGKQAGSYQPMSLAQEGFIHCCYLSQISQVANRFYSGQMDLVLVQINPSRLYCSVVEEDLYNHGQNFPHIYGVLPWNAVTQGVAINDNRVLRRHIYCQFGVAGSNW